MLARARVDARAFKMALYGFVVSAPLSHVLVGELQKAFAGRTGRAAKIGQVLASNLIVSPIQAFCEFCCFVFFFVFARFGGSLSIDLTSRLLYLFGKSISLLCLLLEVPSRGTRSRRL